MSEVTLKLLSIIRANEEKGLATDLHVSPESWRILKADEDAQRNINFRVDGSVYWCGCRVYISEPGKELRNP